MTENEGPFLIGQRGGLAAVGVSQLGRFFDVLDQIRPGGGEAFVGLGFGTTFHKGFNDSRCRHLLATAIEDLLLQLSDESISFIAELDGELRHGAGQ